MTTVLSSKGQVVLRAELRRALGLVPGAVLSIRRKGNTIILEPLNAPSPKAKLTKDPKTGFTRLDPGPLVAPLTNERTRGLLADFP